MSFVKVESVELGFGCNNACSFCAQGELRSVSSAPSLDQLISRIRACAPQATIALVGGEPTLRDDLVEIVAAARSTGRRVLVQTNARRLASPGYARALSDAGVTELDVSVCGSTEPMHDYHTGVAGSFRQTVSGIARARATRLEVGITTVVTRSNLRHLSDVVRVAHRLGARAIHFAPLALVGAARRHAPRLGANALLTRAHLDRATRLAASLGLGWLAADVASDSSVRDWFAGIGSVEQDSAPEPSSARFGSVLDRHEEIRGTALLRSAGAERGSLRPESHA